MQVLVFTWLMLQSHCHSEEKQCSFNSNRTLQLLIQIPKKAQLNPACISLHHFGSQSSWPDFLHQKRSGQPWSEHWLHASQRDDSALKIIALGKKMLFTVCVCGTFQSQQTESYFKSPAESLSTLNQRCNNRRKGASDSQISRIRILMMLWSP